LLGNTSAGWISGGILSLNPVGRGEGSSWERTGRLAAPRAEPALKWRFPPSPGRVPADSANPSLRGSDNIQLFFPPPGRCFCRGQVCPACPPGAPSFRWRRDPPGCWGARTTPAKQRPSPRACALLIPIFFQYDLRARLEPSKNRYFRGFFFPRS